MAAQPRRLPTAGWRTASCPSAPYGLPVPAHACRRAWRGSCSFSRRHSNKPVGSRRSTVIVQAISFPIGSSSSAANRAAAAAAAAEAARSAARLEAIAKTPLWAHGLGCLMLGLGCVALYGYLGRRLHRWADAAEAHEEEVLLGKAANGVGAFGSAALVLRRPAAFALPLVCGVAVLLSLRQFLQAIQVHNNLHAFSKPWASAAVQHTARLLPMLDILTLDLTEVALIVFGVWSLLRLKDHLIKVMVAQTRQDTGTSSSASAGSQERALERVVLPLSGLSSWLVVLAGGLMMLHVLGINVQPLLTVTGVSGIIVGLSAQSVMANMISGINLFLSRPFVVGDRIDVTTSGGARVLTGYVERVDPMRTIMRSDAGLPYMLPNKSCMPQLPFDAIGQFLPVLADMMISNESRIIKSRMISQYDEPRQYITNLQLRLQDVDKAEAVIAGMRKVMDANEGVNKRLAHFIGLSSLENSVNIIVVCHTTPAATRDFGGWRQKLLFGLRDAVAHQGAQFFIPTQMMLVSPPGAVPDKASSPAAGPMDKLQTPPAINGTTAKALAN